ncbi:hypothetical protein K474DRAFT_1696697 [Panus rudis PR-1116 ss-1]|nr:hypothetical protein K474DRAFT_1696697 [Panus rudis PR-1116 ss-1]
MAQRSTIELAPYTAAASSSPLSRQYTASIMNMRSILRVDLQLLFENERGTSHDFATVLRPTAIRRKRHVLAECSDIDEETGMCQWAQGLKVGLKGSLEHLLNFTGSREKYTCSAGRRFNTHPADRRCKVFGNLCYEYVIGKCRPVMFIRSPGCTHMKGL